MSDNEPVYLYSARLHDFLKIGITSNIQRRFEFFNSASPYSVQYLESYRYQNRSVAWVVEQELIKRFKKAGWHHRSEWFIYSGPAMVAFRSISEEFSRDKMSDMESLYDSLGTLRQYAKSLGGGSISQVAKHLIDNMMPLAAKQISAPMFNTKIKFIEVGAESSMIEKIEEIESGLPV